MIALFLPTWLVGQPSLSVARLSVRRPPLSELAQLPESRLPRFVRESEVALQYLRLLGPLDWRRFPDRPDQRFHPQWPPLPYAPFVAAYLVKIDQHIPYMADLRDYLVANPALVWALGFPLVRSRAFSWGFDVQASLPTHRHLSRLLRVLPNAAPQFLLDETVRLIHAALPPEVDFGQTVAVDTKHVIAWVQENNPKAYVTDRYDKTKQPKGDPDCRLGCKRRHNQAPGRLSIEDWPTPRTNAQPVKGHTVGEFYWGYGSGVVATQVAEWGEFVLAELTQPFDQADVSYFHPLMADTERRLGFRPLYGAFDAAFDAFYVYEHFHRPGAEGFAAVPLVARGGHGQREFDANGLPLCAAGLPMPLLATFWCRTGLIEHERGRYGCPLRFPEATGEHCPVNHKNWAQKGCVSTFATSPGARLRYQLDRESAAYKDVYRQRTATERINSQAVAFGIERPKLRNGRSIANHNTLTYVLINLHALSRIRQRQAER